MSVAVSLEGVHKHFGSTHALNGLDLEAHTGEVHGFLGPNGSGKTVTIRIVLGLYRADAGDITVLGGDPWRDAVELHRRIAFVPGDVNLWPSLTGGEVIDLLGRLQGGVDPRRRDELIELFDLDPRRRCRTYSKGNRQKVALVAGLACEAELYILDEPTAGLDPLMEAAFQDHVAELARGGATVLLSSHILAEVERLCDRVSIIRQGRTVQTGTLEELRHLTRTSITVVTDDPITDLHAHPGVHDLMERSGELRFDVDGEHLDAIVRRLAAAGVRSLVSQPPTLEELFLRHYGDEPAADPVGATADAATGGGTADEEGGTAASHGS